MEDFAATAARLSRLKAQRAAQREETASPDGSSVRAPATLAPPAARRFDLSELGVTVTPSKPAPPRVLAGPRIVLETVKAAPPPPRHADQVGAGAVARMMMIG
jgi:hypothetical protein